MGIIFVLSFLWGWGDFFNFWGWVWGIQFLFLIGGGRVFTFFKLTGSGGHHRIVFRGWGVCKKCLPPSPSG